MSIKKYAYLFVVFSLSIATLLALINYFIDPYLLFQSKRTPGINEKKPAAANYSSLYKPYNVLNVKPQTIIVGNSRPEMGINPESPCWPEKNGIVYNLTFPGTGTYGQIRELFQAVAGGQVQNILLGVDFSDFLTNRKEETKEITLSQEYIDLKNLLMIDETFIETDKYQLKKIQDYATTLFSLKTLISSFHTLFSQSPNSVNRTFFGFNPALDYSEILHREGAWVLFEQKIPEIKKMFFKTGLSIYQSEQWSWELEWIRQTIKLVIDKNISLTIFINPYHYIYLETIHDAGYWDDFENFKRSLTNIVNLYGENKVALWDFALYSQYTASPAPQKNNKTPQWNWFWEPAHYKAELGELMLADIFNSNCTNSHAEPVGIKLNNIDIDNHLNQQGNLLRLKTSY